MKSDSRATLSLHITPKACLGAAVQRRSANQTVPLYRIPLLATVGDDAVICGSEFLPFRSAAFREVNLHMVLSYVIDEVRLLDECFRIIQPGGRLTGLAPNNSGFGHADVLNLARYAADIVKKGPPLPELLEAGWRKHYSTGDIEDLMRAAGFDDVSMATSGLLGGEIARSLELIGRQFNRGSRTSRTVVAAQPTEGMASRWMAGSSIIFDARRR